MNGAGFATVGENSRFCDCAMCEEHGPHASDCVCHGMDTPNGVVYPNRCDCGVAP